MSENYKIVSKFIKDISGETPDVETYLYVKDFIPKYQLNIEINSKPLKAQIIEVNTLLKFHDTSESKKKSVLEKKSCKEKSRIIISNKRFIKFRHDVNEVEKYKEIAASWCMKFSKIPKKSKVRCSRCCDASYFCK